MEIENLEKQIQNNELNNEVNLEKEQNNFLDSAIGKAINTGLDIGIRALLPDLIEDQVISIKDNLLNYGLKEGISKTIEEAINFGKSSIGIVTGNFENISQVQLAVKNGGIIDSVSTLLDSVVDKVEEKGVISSNIADLIKRGKDTILNNVESNIENTFSEQYSAIENIDNYINNWKDSFEKQDFDNMEKEYLKLEEQMQTIAPLTKTIEEAKTIELLHNLIKNNGQDFNLSQEQLELVEKLK